MNDQAAAAGKSPRVFALIPGRDFLVVFDDGDLPLPDEDALEELEIQADQRCAPETLGTVSDILLTVAEAITGNVLTSALSATYPSMTHYVERVKAALHHSRARQAAALAGTRTQTPDPATPPEVTQRVHTALKATVGEPTSESELEQDPQTLALRATVEVNGSATVEVRMEPNGKLICITVVGPTL